MTAFIFLYNAPDADSAASFLALQKHGCGYTHGWMDSVQPLNVWFLQVCPADAMITSLQAQLPTWVAARATQTSTIADPEERVEALINFVTDDANVWIDTNAYTHLVTFLKQLPLLRTWIEQEMVTQGLVAYT